MSSSPSTNSNMDSRHDSLLEPEDKSFSGSMNVLSSPLSSVPSDFDLQPVPEDLEVILTAEPSISHNVVASLSLGDEVPANAVPAGLEEGATTQPQDWLRRSDRKRKAPAWYNKDLNPDISDSEVSERPTKQRRNGLSTESKHGRIQNVESSDAVTPSVSDSTESSPNESLSTPDTVQNDTGVTSPPPPGVAKSLIVKLKVRPRIIGASHGKLHEALPEMVQSVATIPSTPETVLDGQQPTAKATEIDLVSLSVSLTHTLPISQKPLPRGQPDAWADNRWDLCESLPGIYSSWQGSYYGRNGVAKSFMLDATSHSRDYMDENVIILRASGSMGKDDDNNLRQKVDQQATHQYHAIINAMNQQNPIAVICGDKNSLIPCKMPHKYNTLDWYKPTHVWTEKDQFKVIKYRLEKLDVTKIGWWVPNEHQNLVELGSLDPPIMHTCESCLQRWTQIYLSGWMCLNRECNKFWSLPDGTQPDPLQLLYDPRFLKQKTPWANEQPPLDFRLPLYTASPIAGEDYKSSNLCGMVCPECGKCNARTKWAGWECTNCGFKHMPKINILPASALQNQRNPVGNAYAASKDKAKPHVEISLDFSYNYRWITYRFRVSATEIAEVVHGVANKVVHEEQEGPNEMWDNLQESCRDMERRRLSNGHMNSFTMNYGMPYKFVAAGQSLPFTGSPWPITEAVSRLNWADRITSQTSIEDQQKFNELYLVAYLENQSMNYHDDGEKGLGSTVATLSLGESADMNFRPKSQYYWGVKYVTRKGKSMAVMTMEPPLPGFHEYELRKRFIAEIQGADYTPEEEENRLAEMAQTLIELSPDKKLKPEQPWLELFLGHGDIVIMRGAQFQKLFEHAVTPLGIMRYALTCRTILPGHLKESELPEYEVEPDQGNYDGSRIKTMRV